MQIHNNSVSITNQSAADTIFPAHVMERKKTVLPNLSIKSNVFGRRKTYGEERADPETKRKNLERFIHSQDKRSRMKTNYHYSFVSNQSRGKVGAVARMQQHYSTDEQQVTRLSSNPSMPPQLSELIKQRIQGQHQPMPQATVKYANTKPLLEVEKWTDAPFTTLSQDNRKKEDFVYNDAQTRLFAQQLIAKSNLASMIGSQVAGSSITPKSSTIQPGTPSIFKARMIASRDSRQGDAAGTAAINNSSQINFQKEDKSRQSNSTMRVVNPSSLALSSVLQRVKPETMRMMHYYQSRFNNRVESLIDKANARTSLSPISSAMGPIRDGTKSISLQRPQGNDSIDVGQIYGDTPADTVVHNSDLPRMESQLEPQSNLPNLITTSNYEGASQTQQQHSMQLIEDAFGEEELKYTKDHEHLVSLKKELYSAKRDLLSYLPPKRFQKSSKDRPLQSKETVDLKVNRKNLLNSMAQIVNGRDKGKYLNSKTTMKPSQFQSQSTTTTQAKGTISESSKNRLFKTQTQR